MDSYYKTVSMYKLSKNYLNNVYLPLLAAYVQAWGNKTHYESALKVVAFKEQRVLKAIVLENEKWYEINDIQDIDIAESIFAEGDELKQAYVGCDVYIFPTLEETEGIVLLEALAAKANVIVRDIPVFDWLNGGTDCYKAKDKDEFERMIKEIYEGKLPSLRENGRKAVENMDIKKIGEKLVKIYNGTAEGGD